MPDRRITRDEILDLPVGAHFWFHFDSNNSESEWIKASADQARPARLGGALHSIRTLANTERTPNYWYLREDNEMTATLTECPFPMPGVALENHGQLRALPVGSVIGYGEGGPETAWTKTGPDSWTGFGGVNWASAEFSVPYVEDDRPFQVMSIPSLTSAELTQLPIGSSVWVNSQRGVHGLYVKEQPASGLCWHQEGDHNRNSNLADIAPTYLVSNGSQLPAEDPVTIPAASVVPGMYLRTAAGSDIYVTEVADGQWSGIFRAAGEDSVVEGLPSYFPDQANYVIRPHDAHLAAMLLWKMERDREQHERAVQLAESEARRAGEATREQWWQQQMARFNTAAQQLAEEKDYCSDYDEFASGWAHIGLTPRERDFTICADYTVRIRRTVSATDSDAAWQVFEDVVSIREGENYTLNGETCEVIEYAEYRTEEA